jgi:hypothetical protein
MNLNKKIEKFKADGIPAYNQKINELIDAVNWLAGVRSINGKVIAESDQGPVIDLSQVNSTQSGPTPWANDPDGNQAGWLKVLVLNPDQTAPPTLRAWEQWVWTSNSLLTTGLPWGADPNGAVAHWLMGANGGVWGTGSYPTGVVGNFIPGYAVYSGDKGSDGSASYHNPYNYTVNPSGGNIANIPTNPPAFYIKAFPSPGGASGSPQISIGGGASSTFPVDTVTWTLSIIYDGTTVLSYNGTTTVNVQPGYTFVPLDPTGWVYDPTGLPGYAHGGGYWIWEYQGPISAKSNPIINQNFVFSSDSGRGWCLSFAGYTDPGFTYLTT